MGVRLYCRVINCELLGGRLELNPTHLQEQKVFLTGEQLPSLLSLICERKFVIGFPSTLLG